MQFGQITAYKCKACGKVLTTEKGIKKHKQHCKYIIPVIKGQINIYDLIKEKKE